MEKPKTDAVYQLKITLKHVRPPVWRRFLVKSDMKVSDLHKVIQTVMGWTNSHLHAFLIGSTNYALPDREIMTDDKDSRKVRLHEVIRREKQKFFYEYDFGDGWEHTIVLEKVLQRDANLKYPTCLAGKRNCPPEDCGGPWGYANLLKILKDPKHAQYQEYKEWIGEHFDPEEFDLDLINDELKTKDYGCHPSW
jgi:hypothetical protein